MGEHVSPPSRTKLPYLAIHDHKCAAVCLHVAHIIILGVPAETPFCPNNLEPSDGPVGLAEGAGGAALAHLVPLALLVHTTRPVGRVVQLRAERLERVTPALGEARRVALGVIPGLDLFRT